MDLIAYLRIFRRRWLLLVIPALAGLVVGWLTLPEQSQPGPVARNYSATATLITAFQVPTEDQLPLNLSMAALFTTLGEVPERAADQLGYEGEPQILASRVSATAGLETGTLAIRSTDTNPKVAVNRVNAFAESTVDFFRDREQDAARSRISALNRQVEDSLRGIRRLDGKLAASPDDAILQARLDSLKSQYALQLQELSTANSQLGDPGPLDLLQPAVAIPNTAVGFTAPSNPSARLGAAALLGLLLGAALALTVERLDARMRTREQVEDAFGLPVLAEIPSLTLPARAQRGVTSIERPASATAEAYRALRSAVLLLRPEPGRGPDSPAVNPHTGNPLVVLVTSALAGEGKTTTVANLAAVMAEAGRRVAVLSFDLRKPQIHEYFDTADGAGISDLLAADRGHHLAQVLRDTDVPGVLVATSGQELGHPGALVASAGPMLEAARNLADVILIDSAPLLTVSDAIDLAQHVDIALVVTRLNRTTNVQASAARRLLSRLGVPALGTVLIGSSPTGVQDGYLLRGLPGFAGKSADAPTGSSRASNGVATSGQPHHE